MIEARMGTFHDGVATLKSRIATIQARVTTMSPDERRRRSRHMLVGAFALLVIIWTVKLSFPKHNYHAHPSQVNTYGNLKSSPQDSFVLASEMNAVNSSKAAVIIDTRFRSNLVPLILHFSTVLGPSWPILIYTSTEAVGLFSASAALARHLHSGLIQIRILPSTVLFTTSDSVSDFMTRPWLWESLAPAEHVLLFQSDSMLCANAPRSVDDYFAYDFIGAPIAEHLGRGYNGGLSLRKRSTILRILDKWAWAPTDDGDERFEDRWFYNRLSELAAAEKAAGVRPEADGAVNLPSMEIARTFAVETIDFPHPLGVHQVHRWLTKQMLSLDEWCPEYKLCSGDYVAV